MKVYQIGKLSKVSPQNLYRFLDEDRPRALSQKSLDALGLLLKLKLTFDYRPKLHGFVLRAAMRYKGVGSEGDLDRLINDPSDAPLSRRIRRAVELHYSDVSKIAGDLRISGTQLYRFLDGSR